MRESTFTLVYWGFIPSFPTKGQLDFFYYMPFLEGDSGEVESKYDS